MAIPKIRAGNDFVYVWAIERNGVAVDLTAATTVRLSYGVGKPCNYYTEIPFEIIDGNKVRSSHNYENTGTYNLRLEFTMAGVDSTVDIDAFVIVGRTALASEATDFAVTSDMAIGFKGDPLTYDDLTPEQIAELQQPATDAIASIQEVELAVETAEGLRVQAEINRQTNTSTAISNAEQATDDANDAAILANEKALLANEKAGLAATATTQANAARDGANNAAQSATNLVNSYATDLAAKENTANKQNSLAPDGTGTKFPTVDAVNAGLASVNNLLVDYTHSSNKEVAISSYDTNADIFTSVAHGLINGDIIAPTLNNLIYEVYPMTLYIGGMENVHYYVVNKTDNTFQISKTNGGASINLTTLATTDLQKWHFERMTAFVINNIPASRNIKVIATGKLIPTANTTYLAPLQIIDSGWSKKTALTGSVTVFGNASNGMMLEMDIQSSDNSFVRWKGWSMNNNSLTTNIPTEINDIAYKNRNYGDITNVSSNGTATIWFNGYNIKIYKL